MDIITELPTGNILPAPTGGTLTDAGVQAVALAAVIAAGTTHTHLRSLTDRRATERDTLDRRA